MKVIFNYSIIFLLGIFLIGCSQENTHSKEIVYTVITREDNQSLFYTGIIRPIKTIVVPSPVEGVIMDMAFQYGGDIKAGDLLFKISSTKFLTDYKTALLQYVKAKSEFTNGQLQLKEAEFLHKNLLISDDEFKTKKTNYYSTQLALVQATDVLENLIHQLNLPNLNFYNLTIADIDKITKALHLQKNSENIQIFAPTAGVVLAANKSDEEVKKVFKGDSVKPGDMLAIIGDLSGFSVSIKVNELTVNQLKVGQTVKVSGIAFKDAILLGNIERIDHQAESSSGGLPTFNVDIIVPKITELQKKTIHVGMSAKVEIDFKDAANITIPIQAIIEKEGKSYVQLWDEKTQSKKLILVQTGNTSVDSIAIKSGLHIGDKIVFTNNTSADSIAIKSGLHIGGKVVFTD